MIIGAIILGIFIFALIGLGLHINERYGGNFDAGVFLGTVTTLLLVLETCLIFIITEKPAPSALDVYQDNTELEITFVNGTPIDTVVVFKKGNAIDTTNKHLLIMTDKAKAYDEAIERAKKIYGNGITEEIFIELKEDNDERIKKNCIHFLELQKQHHAGTGEIEECIAWLEKQGE